MASILLIVIGPLMYFGGYWAAAMSAAQSGQQAGIGTTLMWAAIGFLVFVLVQGIPLNATGQTWGKRITSIKIVDLAGNKPPLGRLLGLRYLQIQLVSNIPLVGPLVAIINVLLIFRGDRRCGHDLIAGTKVVRAN
ncbi:MAG: RDD family protein [Luteimonas sp.]